MNTLNLLKSEKEDNVFILHPKTPVDQYFEETYLKVREIEKRIYSDKQVKLLPQLPGHTLKNEWKLRENTSNKFLKYKNRYFKNSRILDLACGNGWFSNQISSGSEVYGLDINLLELKQAARVFKQPNIYFCYGNILNEIKFPAPFDLITINSGIQYFPDLHLLINRLFSFLREGGEIHILDSPFYNETQKLAAAVRSYNYYQIMGYKEMANNYFHHESKELDSFNWKLIPKDAGLKRLLNKIIRVKESPFPWIVVSKNK